MASDPKPVLDDETYKLVLIASNLLPRTGQDGTIRDVMAATRRGMDLLIEARQTFTYFRYQRTAPRRLSLSSESLEKLRPGPSASAPRSQ
jgi:hypothetical protein